MLKVRVKIRYSYSPRVGEFEGRVSFLLPAKSEEKGDIIALPPILCSRKEFLGAKLDGVWGSVVNERSRTKSVTLYAPSWKGIKREVEAYVKKQIDFLKGVVKENREKVKLVEGKEEEKTYFI